jgi:hypothetical protein
MKEDSKNLMVTPNQIEELSDASLLFGTIFGSNITKYKQSKVYKFPFKVTDEILKQIEEKAREKISISYKNIKINFDATVSFQDLMTINYDTLDDFLAKAGLKRDPESASLSWSMFRVIKSHIDACYITIDFVTEKKITTSIWQPGDFLSAYVKLTVSGSNSEWVEKTFFDIEPVIDLCKLSGIYRPLWIFRSKFFVQFCSLFISMFSGILSFDIFSDLLTSGERLKILSNIYDEKLIILNEIKSESEIANKIDILSTYIINPTNPINSSTTDYGTVILNIILFLVTYITLYLICLTLLPKLAPNSHLAIGLNKIRVDRYLNLFKFIVLDFLVLGLLSPIIISIIRFFL